MNTKHVVLVPMLSTQGMLVRAHVLIKHPLATFTAQEHPLGPPRPMSTVAASAPPSPMWTLLAWYTATAGLWTARGPGGATWTPPTPPVSTSGQPTAFLPTLFPMRPVPSPPWAPMSAPLV